MPMTTDSKSAASWTTRVSSRTFRSAARSRRRSRVRDHSAPGDQSESPHPRERHRHEDAEKLEELSDLRPDVARDPASRRTVQGAWDAPEALSGLFRLPQVGSRSDVAASGEHREFRGLHHPQYSPERVVAR